MILRQPFNYVILFTPKRARRQQIGYVSDAVAFDIRELSVAEAPVAVRWTDRYPVRTGAPLAREVRAYDGKFYDRMGTTGPMFARRTESLGWPAPMAGLVFPSLAGKRLTPLEHREAEGLAPVASDRETWVAFLAEQCRRLIVIDGTFFRETSEPEYRIEFARDPLRVFVDVATPDEPELQSVFLPLGDGKKLEEAVRAFERESGASHLDVDLQELEARHEIVRPDLLSQSSSKIFLRQAHLDAKIAARHEDLSEDDRHLAVEAVDARGGPEAMTRAMAWVDVRRRRIPGLGLMMDLAAESEPPVEDAVAFSAVFYGRIG